MPLAVALTGLLLLPPIGAMSQVGASRTALVGPECENCRIVSEPLVRLGDPEGPGMLEAAYNNVRVDGMGQYVVFGGPSPYFWVFDGSGDVVGRFGRSGEGPGEFAFVTGIAVGSADSVFVLDAIRRRVSVYAPELAYARHLRMWHAPDGPSLFVGGSLLLNGGIATEDLVGRPFHALNRTGSSFRSFGAVTGGVSRTGMQDIADRRVLAEAGADSFWAARMNQYMIERWAMDGRLLGTLHREAPWFEVWWESQSDAETPPVTRIVAMEQVGDTLWVLAWVAGERWRSAVEPDLRGYTVTNRDEYHSAVLEVVDLGRGVVIASQRMPLLFDDLLEGGLAVRNDTDEVGNPVVWIHRLEIRSP